MGDTLSVSIDTSKDAAQPTLEEEAAKYDNPPPADDRPEWLPEKFKSTEDLAKAYSELEKKLGSKASTTTEAAPEPESTEDPTEVDKSPEDQAREVTENAGLDFDELSANYWKNGSLGDVEYTKLEKAGIPKAVVDSFIAGQQALVSATRNSVFEAVGGEDSYNDMTSWAASKLASTEIKAYNQAVDSGNVDAAMMAVKGLKARYEAEVGFEPTREIRGASAKAGETTYRSIAEMQKDMSDPRYKADPAFRKDVERKLGRSDIF
ncbi:capsid assembly protein [uncultured Caudovirales phage]|uniref:Capsid assembly protein n=1 Tax=uncultured Caudovirales phage TaxID=2100421 RepID=A0A6J5KUB0_9CAUD|nr:capsid assembly protein [uncultured Caudovirales phage]